MDLISNTSLLLIILVPVEAVRVYLVSYKISTFLFHTTVNKKDFKY